MTRRFLARISTLGPWKERGVRPGTPGGVGDREGHLAAGRGLLTLMPSAPEVAYPAGGLTCFRMMSVACMMHLGSSPWLRARMAACSRDTLRVLLPGRGRVRQDPDSPTPEPAPCMLSRLTSPHPPQVPAVPAAPRPRLGQQDCLLRAEGLTLQAWPLLSAQHSHVPQALHQACGSGPTLHP